MKQRLIDKVQEHWKAGRSLEAGRLLYENIPVELRPAWAAEVLAIARSHVPPIPEVEAVLEIASNPSRWPEARETFRAVRKLTLQAEEPLYEGVLILAENVAKVTYNSSGHPPPFDHDSGWWIAQNLKYIIEQVNDPEFTADAWSTLSSERFMRSRK